MSRFNLLLTFLSLTIYFIIQSNGETFIDYSDPNNPKKVNLWSKHDSRVDENGFVVEHVESRVATSLRDNPHHHSSSYISSTISARNDPPSRFEPSHQTTQQHSDESKQHKQQPQTLSQQQQQNVEQQGSRPASNGETIIVSDSNRLPQQLSTDAPSSISEDHTIPPIPTMPTIPSIPPMPPIPPIPNMFGPFIWAPGFEQQRNPMMINHGPSWGFLGPLHGQFDNSYFGGPSSASHTTQSNKRRVRSGHSTI